VLALPLDDPDIVDPAGAVRKVVSSFQGDEVLANLSLIAERVSFVVFATDLDGSEGPYSGAYMEIYGYSYK